MKTTINIPDDLYRLAKADAALRGRSLKDMFVEGLRLALEAPHEASVPPVLSRRTKRTRDSDRSRGS